jgi:chromosome segregation protein
MISRFIEARPEDLRLFLEEAAGISKYKERRRETENRMPPHAREPGTPDDLREEVASSSSTWSARPPRRRSTALKDEERRLSAELTGAALARCSTGTSSNATGPWRRQENRLEAERAEQRRLEAEIEEQRDAHAEANDRFNAVQGRYYAVGSEIARLEAGDPVRHARRATANRRDLGRVRRELEQPGQ